MANQDSCSNFLSDGSIDMMVQQKDDTLIPIVQILGTKQLSGNRVRVVISDGATTNQHCLLYSEEITQMHTDGLLSRFTVVRFDQYTITVVPQNGLTVIQVFKITIIKRGWFIINFFFTIETNL